MKKCVVFALVIALVLCGGCAKLRTRLGTLHNISVGFDNVKKDEITAEACTDDTMRRQSLLNAEAALAPYGTDDLGELGVAEIQICVGLTYSGRSAMCAATEGKDGSVIFIDAERSHEEGFARALNRLVFICQSETKSGGLRSFELIDPFGGHESGENFVPAVFEAAADSLPFEPSYISALASLDAMLDQAELYSVLICGASFSDAERSLIAGDAYIQKKAGYLLDAFSGYSVYPVLLSNFNALFSAPFYAERIYQSTSETKLRTGSSELYPLAASLGDNVLYYSGKSLVTESGLLLSLLDSEHNRVYAYESELTRVDTLDFSAEKQLRDMLVYVTLEPAVDDIYYSTLPSTVTGRLDYFDIKNGGILGAALLQRAVNIYSKQTHPVYLAPVINLHNQDGEYSTYQVGDTLLVDVERCRDSELVTAIKEML